MIKLFAHNISELNEFHKIYNLEIAEDQIPSLRSLQDYKKNVIVSYSPKIYTREGIVDPFFKGFEFNLEETYGLD